MPAALSESDLKRLVATASSTTASDSASSSPFIKYRALLYPYRVAIAGGMR